MTTERPEALPTAFLHYPPKKPALARVDFMPIATKSERGAGWVTVPLIGQPQAMPDLSQLTERGAKAWAGVDAQGLREGFTAADMATVSAQGFRDGVASVSAGSEPVAWQYRSVRDKGLWFDCTEERAKQRAAHPDKWDVRYLYTHHSPQEGMAGWRPTSEMRAVVAVAVTMLYDTHPEDVLRVFDLCELEKISSITMLLGSQKVEDIYRSAWDHLTSGAADLRTAAQAVVDRWDTPLWKDVPSTAEYIGRLRAALAAGQATAAPAEPDPTHGDHPQPCDSELFESGVSVGLFDIPQWTAEALCKGIAAATGARVDWHYIGGRVHVKALPAPTSAEGAAHAALPDEREMLKHALWLASSFTVHRYMMSCAEGRWSGAEKAACHDELCCLYVAVFRGVEIDRVRVDFEEDWVAVHDATQELTDHMDVVIGFPLKGVPDYESLAPKFFAHFHRLATRALRASHGQAPAWAGEAAEHYRNAIASACEGWTMPDGLRKHLETALWSPPTPQPTQARAGAVPLTCEWTHNDDDGFWDTACGEAWRFDDGGPGENNMHFCHSCGNSLRIKGGQHGITAARARLLDSDLSNLTERGAKAWAGVAAQGLRDGGASLSANAGQATAAPAQPAAQQGVAYAALPESFLEIPDVQDESGINAYYSREVVLECIDAALASHGQAPADAKALAEADRRAGEAERLLATCKEYVMRFEQVRSRMKYQWGADQRVSFDEVWDEALALKKAAQAAPQAADSVQEDAARQAIEKVLALFPFNALIQKFSVNNGPCLTADNDDEFYSVKRVLAFLTEIKTTLDAARKQGEKHDR